MSRKPRNMEKKMVRINTRQLSIHRDPSPVDFRTTLPDEYANHSIQESDNGFFENFTSISEKQAAERRKVSTQEDKDKDKPPPRETKIVGRRKASKLSSKEFQMLYIEVLYTIKHKIGTTTGGHSPYMHDLYAYAQDAFRVSPEDHAKLLAKASEEKPPIVILNVTVVEAKNLEAKDANGYSDPYCMLGVMPASRLRAEDLSDEEVKQKKKNPLKKFSDSLKKRKPKKKDLSIPAKYIRTTTVKQETLNPIFNEKFRFDLEDGENDMLHLDIWDHDDESSVFDAAKKLNEVSGFKGLNRFFKQIAQSARTSSSTNVDDFLGYIAVCPKDIPSTGADVWYDLEGRSERSSVQGQINLKLALATREDRGIPEEDNWNDIRQHEDLMGIFIEHEFRLFKDPMYKWMGCLPQVAGTILHQHAIQGDITDVQQAMCRWLAYSQKHMEHPFDYKYLLQLLEDLNAKWTPGSLSREEEESLAESFKTFTQFCLSLLRKQRDLFPPRNKVAYGRLENLLKCLACMYDMKLYQMCCPFQKDLRSEVTGMIKKGTQDWYEQMAALVKPQITADEDVLNSLLDLVNIVNLDAYKAAKYYNKLFTSIMDVRYFDITYKQINKLLSGDMGSCLEDELAEALSPRLDMIHKDIDYPDADSPTRLQMGIRFFELYLALKQFRLYGKYLTCKQDVSCLQEMHLWFKMAVQRWLALAKHKLIRRIKKSVDLDRDTIAESLAGKSVDFVVQHSTSAVDVSCCFRQVIEFWRQLSWPDPEDAYAFVMTITDDLSSGAMYYADLIHNKLKSAGYYDEEGQFDVTEQLCVTINNIEQVRRALMPLPELMDYPSIGQGMETLHGERIGAQAKIALLNVIRNADENMVNKIKKVTDRVADRMRPDIKKDVFHLCWAPESVPAEEAINHLMEYLDSNLLTLNRNLLRTNLDRILHSIWIEVIEEINEVIETEQETDDGKSILFYERLYDSLSIIVDFFHAGQKGLPLDTILTPEYKKLESKLAMYKLDTEELIEQFYIEKTEEQNQAPLTKLGSLTVRSHYKQGLLIVEILHAKDLIPLDTNGLSDPYVMVELCPEHIFRNEDVKQTNVIKKTLNPLFDESFEFSVAPSQCKAEGATVMFTVMDHDVVFQNDFAGEVYMSLNNIPGLKDEDVSAYEALKQITNPLISPKHKESGALTVLQSRQSWDKVAAEFVKKRKLVEEKEP